MTLGEVRPADVLECWRRPKIAPPTAIVAAVALRHCRTIEIEHLARKIIKGGCFIDIKAGFDETALAAAGLHVWRL